MVNAKFTAKGLALRIIHPIALIRSTLSLSTSLHSTVIRTVLAQTHIQIELKTPLHSIDCHYHISEIHLCLAHLAIACLNQLRFEPPLA